MFRVRQADFGNDIKDFKVHFKSIIEMNWLLTYRGLVCFQIQTFPPAPSSTSDKIINTPQTLNLGHTAKNLWCLCNLVHYGYENETNHFTALNNYFQTIYLWIGTRSITNIQTIKVEFQIKVLPQVYFETFTMVPNVWTNHISWSFVTQQQHGKYK